jgi:hypothetical protein
MKLAFTYDDNDDGGGLRNDEGQPAVDLVIEDPASTETIPQFAADLAEAMHDAFGMDEIPMRIAVGNIDEAEGKQFRDGLDQLARESRARDN